MLIDNEKVEELFDLYFEDIYHYCLFKGLEHEEATDISQETFTALIEKSDGLDDANLRAWLYKVATNKIMNYFNHKRVREKYREYETEYYISENVRDSYRIDDELLAIEEEGFDINSMKNDVLGSLSPEDRKLYDLIYSEHKSYREIGEDMGISERTINMRAYRLKHRIKTAVKALFETIMMIFTII